MNPLKLWQRLNIDWDQLSNMARIKNGKGRVRNMTFEALDSVFYSTLKEDL